MTTGTTQYIDVPDGIGKAMLYLPVAVHPEQVPLLVYYHGHADNDKTLPKSMAEYVAYRSERDFRTVLDTKKVVLIEPWGGVGSRFGGPGTAAGLPGLVESAMQAAAGKKVQPGSLILAGFSGGGVALEDVVTGLSGPSLSLLSEVWCLDCMYERKKHQVGVEWGTWASQFNVRLRVALSTGEGSDPGTGPRHQAWIMLGSNKKQSEDSLNQSSKNVSVETRKSGHEALPAKCMNDWL